MANNFNRKTKSIMSCHSCENAASPKSRYDFRCPSERDGGYACCCPDALYGISRRLETKADLEIGRPIACCLPKSNIPNFRKDFYSENAPARAPTVTKPVIKNSTMKIVVTVQNVPNSDLQPQSRLQFLCPKFQQFPKSNTNLCMQLN